MQMWLWYSVLKRSVLKRCTVNKCILCTALVLVVYNEYLCFPLSSWTWASIPVKRDNEDEMKILIVADPQIVGLQDEHWLFGIITRWDCDKYLKSGFQRALNHVNPAVIVFLGDLIDEGSQATDVEYESYVKRFNDIFQIPHNVQTVFVPGDNDVGGEWMDVKDTRKLNRFYKHFRNTSIRNGTIVKVDPVDFIPISFDVGESVSSSSALYAQLSDTMKSSSAEYRVVCNHMSIINRQVKDYKQALHALAALQALINAIA